MTVGILELWRQDDNGQRFLIGRYPNREKAERHLAELNRAGHKQIYWIDELPGEPERTDKR